MGVRFWVLLKVSRLWTVLVRLISSDLDSAFRRFGFVEDRFQQVVSRARLSFGFESSRRSLGV